MAELIHHQIETNGIEMHVVTAGGGPPVFFCHGFPGLWYSWRHQMPVIAKAGFQAIAVDQRGYGGSSRPSDPTLYDAKYVMDDVLGVLDALGHEKAVFVGHDFGAQQVCNLAVRHADRVAGVVIMSCPYDFDLAGRGGKGSGSGDAANPDAAFAGGLRPSEAFAMAAESHFLHMHYFQEIGPAEKELAARPRDCLQNVIWALSGQGEFADYTKFPSKGTGYLDINVTAPPLPWDFMSTADMDVYVQAYTDAEPEKFFIGGLNSYRTADRNWELGANYADANIEVPALFIAGAEDIVLKMIDPEALEIQKRRVPGLTDTVLIPGAGHFVQMEQPEATNATLLNFLKSLD